MKCSIPALNLKVLGRAIHSLAKIGDELHIEPLGEGLTFRTVNSARSAYASFVFSPSFFSYYSFDGDNESYTENDDLKCKIAMKSCLNVFRTTSSLDKNVESCQLRLDSNNENLIFELRCRYGITKIHYLPIIECEILQAVYTKDNVPNQLIAEAKVFVEAIHNFQTTHDEITFSVNPQSIMLSNYVENAPDPKKVMRTELSLYAGEFEKFCVPEENSITFRLKELRAMLSFAENVNLPIAVNFETTGRPAVFVIKANTFEANFVLATLSQEDTQSISSQDTVKINKTNSSKETSRPTTDIILPNLSINGKVTHPNPPTSHVSKSASRRKDLSQDSALFDFVNEGPSSSNGRGRTNSSTIPVKMNHGDKESLFSEHISDVNEELIIPRTPPLLKKARHVFKRCFETTYNPKNIPGCDDVLESDSGNENSN